MTEDAQERIDPNEFNPPKLYHVRIVRVGLLDLIVGLLIITIGILDVSFSSVAYDLFPASKAGIGIWVGIEILLTGIVGVLQSKSELRRKTLIAAFFFLSCLSWVLSIVMIGVAIAEIAQSEFMEGKLKMQEKLTHNGTDCLNLTIAEETGIRCVATATFDQKLVSDSLFIALGYIESIGSFYAMLVSYTIVKSSSQHVEEIEMSNGEDIPKTSGHQDVGRRCDETTTGRTKEEASTQQSSDLSDSSTEPSTST